MRHSSSKFGRRLKEIHKYIKLFHRVNFLEVKLRANMKYLKKTRNLFETFKGIINY